MENTKFTKPDFLLTLHTKTANC